MLGWWWWCVGWGGVGWTANAAAVRAAQVTGCWPAAVPLACPSRSHGCPSTPPAAPVPSACSPRGTFVDDVGQDSCLPCPPGKYSNTFGSKECKVRPAAAVGLRPAAVLPCLHLCVRSGAGTLARLCTCRTQLPALGCLAPLHIPYSPLPAWCAFPPLPTDPPNTPPPSPPSAAPADLRGRYLFAGPGHLLQALRRRLLLGPRKQRLQALVSPASPRLASLHGAPAASATACSSCCPAGHLQGRP